MVTSTEGLAARNKALHGLAISMTFGQDESVQSEFNQIKDALLRWQRSRGKACGALKIEYHVKRSEWQTIENFWADKIESDHLIRSAFASIGEVEISLITPDGRDIRNIGFELSGNE